MCHSHQHSRVRPVLSPAVLLSVLASVLAFILALAGCGELGMLDAVKDKAREIPKSIKAARQELDRARTKYEGIRDKDPVFQTLGRTAQKEDWEGAFTRSEETLDRARATYNKEMKPLLKADKVELEAQVIRLTQQLNKEITSALGTGKYPLNRFRLLKQALDSMDWFLSTFQERAQRIQDRVSALEAGALAKALADFPDSKAAIQNRFAPFSKLRTDARDRADRMQEIFQVHEAGGPADYGRFLDIWDALASDLATLTDRQTAFETDLTQLHQSYTKILQDMDIRYTATIGRESWDENSDYYNPKKTLFTREVSPTVFETLENTRMDAIAAITAGYPKSRFVNHIGDTWHRMDLDPVADWPDGSAGHNAAEFWIETLVATYFHKYLIEENGETRETDWEKVPPSFYEQNRENLGMAVLSKPYGVFEADALAQAAPPGMAYVGNPRYGEWKTDENGNEFWSWYGKWAFFSNLFFMPPSFYYYGGWTDWNRHYKYKKPYYGTNKNGRKIYGTYGAYVKKSPRFQRTAFAKTGGFKQPPASVRGAGASVRGGGPRGKGK